MDYSGHIRISSEQIPNYDSSLTLGKEVDSLGLRRVKLDWQITDFDARTIKILTLAFAMYVAENGFGNVKLVDWLLQEPMQVPGVGEGEWLGAGWHHMGTTRMGGSPKEGVVDSNAKVFGLDNFYIAGSSVFCTGGHANPTFTILQLALRLSDHLVNQHQNM